MKLSDLPPGVSVNDIPGNRPEDRAWDHAHDWVDGMAEKFGLSPNDLIRVVARGLVACGYEAPCVCELNEFCSVEGHTEV